MAPTRFRRSFVAVVVVSSASVMTLAVTSEPAPAAILLPTATCAKVLFVGARGSGQSPDGVTTSGGKYDNGTGLGPQIYAFYQRFTAQLNLTIQADSIGRAYPSYSIDLLKPSGSDLKHPSQWSARIAKWMSGLSSGWNAAYNTLASRATSCPQERIVLAGYSQGAMLIHRVLGSLNANHRSDILNRVDGVALIADGDRVPNSKAQVIGDPAAGAGGIGVAFGNGLSPYGDVPAAVQPVAVNVCTKNDLVCDFRGYPSYWSLINYQTATTIHTASYTATVLGPVAVAVERRVQRHATPPPPVLGPVTVNSTAGVSHTLIRVNGAACPKSPSGHAYVTYSPNDTGYGGNVEDAPGKPWFTFAMMAGAPGALTVNFKCVSDTLSGQTIAVYPPLTFHVTRAAMTLQVTPTTVLRGQTITLSSPNGCGPTAKPSELADNIYLPNYSPPDIGGNLGTVPASGLWRSFKVTIPKTSPTGTGQASVFCVTSEGSFVYANNDLAEFTVK